MRNESKEIVDVSTGEIAVRKGLYILRAMAIGSCIVVAAFDSKTQNAGMAHIMLPGYAPQLSPGKSKYAADGIGFMLSQMTQSGSILTDIDFCLVGAGNVLRKDDDTICNDNMNSVISIMREKCIRAKASVLGGFKRKSVFLDTQTGRFSYTEGDEQEKPLWQSVLLTSNHPQRTEQ